MELQYNQNVEKNLAEIRKKLRLHMNGELSEMIVNSGGARYKAVYGTQLPELRHLAQEYVSDAQLAKCLWNMQIRETMILATLLFPPQEFSEAQADTWVHSLLTTEMAELLPMLLLKKMPFAAAKAGEWMDNNDLLVRQLACNLFLNIKNEMPEAERTKLLAKIVEKSDENVFYQTLLLVVSADEETARNVLEIMRLQHASPEKYAEMEANVKFYFDL